MGAGHSSSRCRWCEGPLGEGTSSSSCEEYRSAGLWGMESMRLIIKGMLEGENRQRAWSQILVSNSWRDEAPRSKMVVAPFSLY